MESATHLVVGSYRAQTAQEGINTRLIIIHNTLCCTNITLTLVLTLTAWLSKLKRSSTWYGALSTVIYGAVISILLVGRQTKQHYPSLGLCLTQAALIYSVSVLDSLYALTFILEAYMVLRLALPKIKGSHIPLVYIMMYHAVPLFAFSGTFVGVFVYGVNSPSTVERSPTGFFCHITSPAPRELAATVAISCMVITIALEVLIIATLRHISGSWKSLFKDDAHIAPDSIVRVLLFSIVPMLAIAASGGEYGTVTPTQDANLSIILVIADTIVCIIFGSQKDILRAWTTLFRRKQRL